MFDIKLIRENPDSVREQLANKNEKPEKVDEILALDVVRRKLISQSEELKAKKNTVSTEVGKLKKEGKDATAIIAEMKTVSDAITEMDVQN